MERKDVFDKFESTFKMLKELALLGLTIFLFWNLKDAIPIWVDELKTVNVDEVSVLGITLKATQAQNTLAINQSARQTGGSDTAVVPATKAAVESLQVINRRADSIFTRLGGENVSGNNFVASSTGGYGVDKNPYWVYFGENKDNTWVRKYFTSDTPPKTGDILQTTNDVYERSDQPKKDTNGVWNLGSVLGICCKGQKMEVKQAVDIPGVGNGQLWWIKVQP
jgi:hypothetical protein